MWIVAVQIPLVLLIPSPAPLPPPRKGQNYFPDTTYYDTLKGSSATYNYGDYQAINQQVALLR